MARYFVDPSSGALRGLCLLDEPANPYRHDIVELPDTLPAPMERCQFVRGVLAVDPRYDAESESAKGEIAKLEAEIAISYRELREFILAAAAAIPALAGRGAAVKAAELETQISELRKKVR